MSTGFHANGRLSTLAVILMLSAIGRCFAGDKTELEFTVWSENRAHLALLDEIGRAYSAEHPSVSVRFTVIQPYSAFPRVIAVRVTSANPPDGSWMLERLAPQFIASSALLDLRSAARKYSLEDFAPSTMRLWRRGNAVYGLPFSTSPFFILYNRDLFERAGVPAPPELLARGQWTWETLEAVSRQITRSTGRYAYSFWMDDDAIFALTPVLRAYGADFWDETGRCGLTSPQALEAVSLFHRMLAVDATIAPPGGQGSFFDGDVAMTIAQLSMVDRLKDAGFRWGMAPLPAGPAGKVRLIGQAGIVAYRAGHHPADSAGFAAFLTSWRNVARLAQFFPPARVSVIRSSAFLKANPLVPPEIMDSVIGDGLAFGRVLPVHENYGKIEPIVRLLFARLSSPNTDVGELLQEMSRAIQPYLGSGRREP